MNSALKCNRQLNRRKKASNAGFSLVELLIAVTILAIIVIPLLHLFVTSTRINVKSRQMLRATTVAQDIMEGLKAYTLEEVRTQFTPADGVSTGSYFFPTEGFYVLNSSLIQGGVREITELENDDPNNPASQIFYFGIKNLKMQGGEYDALIRLDASTYGIASTEGANDRGETPGAGAHDNEFNGAFFAEIGSVAEAGGEGTATDSSYHEHKKLNDAVLKDIKGQIEASGVTLPSDWDDKKLEDFFTERTIDVVIEDAGSTDVSGNPECKATITFTYKCTYNGATYTSYGDIGSEAGEVKNITRTFSSGNFYLFYYPMYVSGKWDYINFQINNADKLFDADHPMLKTITLAKQIRSDVDTEHRIISPELSDTELQVKENSYMAKVTVDVDRALGSNLNFRTNVNTNMSNLSKSIDPVTGETVWGELPDSNVMIVPLFDLTKFNQIGLTGDNVSDKVTNVIYDIEITIYETGAADYFGDPNFETNNEVHKLATITNLD